MAKRHRTCVGGIFMHVLVVQENVCAIVSGRPGTARVKSQAFITAKPLLSAAPRKLQKTIPLKSWRDKLLGLLSYMLLQTWLDLFAEGLKTSDPLSTDKCNNTLQFSYRLYEWMLTEQMPWRHEMKIQWKIGMLWYKLVMHNPVQKCSSTQRKQSTVLGSCLFFYLWKKQGPYTIQWKLPYKADIFQASEYFYQLWFCSDI